MKPTHTKPRLFLAIPIPNDLKLQLKDWCAQMKPMLPFKRWIFPEDFHITLKFLGDVDNDTLESLKTLVEQWTAKQTPFALALTGLHTFGKMDSPRILWTGVSGDLEPLLTLQKKIDGDMGKLGFVCENRAYTPHLTLAKNYSGKTSFETPFLEQAIRLIKMPLTWDVCEVVLYQTHLGSEPMYQSIAKFPFDLKSSV